jgi:small neutral amino acid transporter SnatA (MarC family)
VCALTKPGSVSGTRGKVSLNAHDEARDASIAVVPVATPLSTPCPLSVV